jgi:type II secretion system protein H
MLFKKDKGFTPHHFLGKEFSQIKTTKRGGGFTLIELMVVMTIISIMTAVVLTNYRGGNQQLALDRSANKLAQDIRRAQGMAMSTAQCPSGTDCAGQVPPRYGIYMGNSAAEKSYYWIFADCVKGGCSTDDGIWGPSEDEKVETQHYETGVEFVGWEAADCFTCSCGAPSDCPDCLPGGQKRTNITFKPPDPKTEIILKGPEASAHRADCSEVTITLRVGTSGPTTTVTINNAGLIYVE